MSYRIIKICLVSQALAFSLGTGISCAQTREYELKAGWLYQFGNTLIDWNMPIGDEFVIGVFGDFPQDFDHHLQRVARLRINNKPVRITQYKRLADFTANSKPAILFISKQGPGATAQQRLQRAKEVVGDHPVLLVGDTDQLDDETAISFKIEANGRLVLRRNTAVMKPHGVSLRNNEIWERLLTRESVENVEQASTEQPGNSRPRE